MARARTFTATTRRTDGAFEGIVIAADPNYAITPGDIEFVHVLTAP